MSSIIASSRPAPSPVPGRKYAVLVGMLPELQLLASVTVQPAPSKSDWARAARPLTRLLL